MEVCHLLLHAPFLECSPSLFDDIIQGNVELLALERLDETSAQLQKQGDYLEALECMERGLVLRQYFFGAESDEVWKACKTLGEMCNLLAMTYLQQEDFNMVLELLKKAEILTERDAGGRAATFNNLACYYRRQGKLHAALLYLQKVSESLTHHSPMVCFLFPSSRLLINMNGMMCFSLLVGIKDRGSSRECTEPC
jgi:tetratricopeptide (TPR) repeat protein